MHAYQSRYDLTLADEDNNSIPTDDGNRAIIGNVAMQVAPPGGQSWNQCKWRHLVVHEPPFVGTIYKEFK